jgi:hypothetical protein
MRLNLLFWLLAAALGAIPTVTWAWGNHALASYRVFENMPEVAKAAPVKVERLEDFLKAQEKNLEKVLADQESWLRANIPNYPARPDALAFVAKPGRDEAALRLAFLHALRVAPNSRFAMYVEVDLKSPQSNSALVAPDAVDTLPRTKEAPKDRFIAIQPGDLVEPIKVLASASYEPDYGLDINLFEDSRSDWGKLYGFGKIPFGNPNLVFSSQAPFHMGFFNESKVLYTAAPFLKRTMPLMRVNQYTGLAAHAFKTGHAYWGWRFTGLALHYIQDMSQPYHASVSIGSSTSGLLGVEVLAKLGFAQRKNDTITLLSNRHLTLESYQSHLLQLASTGQGSPAVATALGNLTADSKYPAWSPMYLRDVVATQAFDFGQELDQAIANGLPARYVKDPAFDFGAVGKDAELVAETTKVERKHRELLEQHISTLLTNFGAHSRNLVRGVLKAAQ